MKSETGLHKIEVLKRFGIGVETMHRGEAVAAFYLAEIDDRRIWGELGDRIEIDKPLFEKALCDGAVHRAGDKGGPGRVKRSVSRALKKKILLRDGGACRVPGCGKMSSLQIDHPIPLSAGGGNGPSNLILTCIICHSNIHEGRLRRSGTFPDFKFQHVGEIRMLNRRIRQAGR